MNNKIIKKIDLMLTSILGNANKSCTMSVLPFSTAINNGVLFKKKFLFKISLKIQLKLNHHSKKHIWNSIRKTN